MARRPTDYTAQMQATEERRRLQEEKQREEAQRERDLRDRQAKSYGEVVREIFPRGITIDVLAGLLLDSREHLQSKPKLEAEWSARGADYFRPAIAKPKQLPGSEGATGNGDAGNSQSQNGHAGDGHAPTGAPALPSRARTPAAPGTPDLLGSLAPDQPGQSPAAESGGHDRQP
jgi:cell division protein FtsN